MRALQLPVMAGPAHRSYMSKLSGAGGNSSTGTVGHPCGTPPHLPAVAVKTLGARLPTDFLVEGSKWDQQHVLVTDAGGAR